jgi:probable F420-dependent oxidoreductase
VTDDRRSRTAGDRDKEFRFGVSLPAIRSRAALAEAAEATTLRLGTYVLNAGFYKPALLARDAGTANQSTDGRPELGHGAGYVREEFEAAEIPFPAAASRIRHLEHISSYLGRELPGVPILTAGSGEKVLGVAARHADIIGLTGTPGGTTGNDPLAQRIAVVRHEAGDRFDGLELNLSITAAPTGNSRVPDLSMVRRFAPHLSDRVTTASGCGLGIGPRDRRHADRLPREVRRDVSVCPGSGCGGLREGHLGIALITGHRR